MTGLEKVEIWLSESKGSLIQKYNSMGLKASGRWEQELETKATETKDGYNALITAPIYTGILVDGRKPNKNKDKLKGFAYYASKSWAKEWCKAKGIDERYAYPIALSIGENGIKVPNSRNEGTLVSSVINDKSIEQLVTSVCSVVLENLFQGIDYDRAN